MSWWAVIYVSIRIRAFDELYNLMCIYFTCYKRIEWHFISFFFGFIEKKKNTNQMWTFVILLPFIISSYFIVFFTRKTKTTERQKSTKIWFLNFSFVIASLLFNEMWSLHVKLTDLRSEKQFFFIPRFQRTGIFEKNLFETVARIRSSNLNIAYVELIKEKERNTAEVNKNSKSRWEIKQVFAALLFKSLPRRGKKMKTRWKHGRMSMAFIFSILDALPSSSTGAPSCTSIIS